MRELAYLNKGITITLTDKREKKKTDRSNKKFSTQKKV